MGSHVVKEIARHPRQQLMALRERNEALRRTLDRILGELLECSSAYFSLCEAIEAFTRELEKRGL